MAKFTITIHAEPGAPTKPAWGAVCNGCGVCCLVEACPLGVVLSGRRPGACMALRWAADQSRYVCGAMTDAPMVLAASWLPVPMFLQPTLAGRLPALARRWVSAGTGCDCDLEIDQTHTPAVPKV